MIEIVHSRPAEMPVGSRKSGRLDDVGGRAQARAQAQNRSGVLGDIGLEKRNLHGVVALAARVNVRVNVLNKSRSGADLVHCTLAGR
ncbi:hypothetical protein [Bradyrhizobium sp. CSA112]|uniref:hypothetical protein n=1 Tax=Bradyrhizobium sp. CSA112 TaxID=2699170 RepID=UPI0023B03903|nr:hypothetical protein [Bradyrhizobium sp. CSA112]